MQGITAIYAAEAMIIAGIVMLVLYVMYRLNLFKKE